MKLRFLCAAHRAQLTKSPLKAISYWQHGLDTGTALYHQGLWHEALPHLGCAFEISEILMTAMTIEPQEAYEAFAHSAKLLAESFENIGNMELAQQIYRLAINRLEREYSKGSLEKYWANQYLQGLYRHGQIVQRCECGKNRMRNTLH